jgi:hypothetical protein
LKREKRRELIERAKAGDADQIEAARMVVICQYAPG